MQMDMRGGALLVPLLAAACASGSADERAPDSGSAAAACTTSGDCDDGDSCTTDVCSLGRCTASAVDHCAELSPVIEDGFESVPGMIVDDGNLGGWQAVESDGCPVGLEIRLDDPFDYGKPAAFVDGAGGWRLTTTGGGKVSLVTTPGDAGGYSMNVMGTTSDGSYGQASHAISGQPAGQVEIGFMAAGNAKEKWLTLDEGGSSRFYLYFDSDGQVKYSNAGSKVTLQSYAGDTWYRVRMAWDAARDRVSVDIGDSHHPDLALYQPIARQIDRVRMRTAGSSGLSFLIDDVSASGGDQVMDGLASLRIGRADGACDRAAGASREFDPVAAGALSLELQATAAAEPYLLELTQGGSGGVAIELAADGSLRWRGGDEVAVLPGSWRAGERLRVELRWDHDSFDLWLGDDHAVTASGLAPAQPIAAGLDQLRLAIPPGGALWVDQVRVDSAR